MNELAVSQIVVKVHQLYHQPTRKYESVGLQKPLSQRATERTNKIYLSRNKLSRNAAQ